MTKQASLTVPFPPSVCMRWWRQQLQRQGPGACAGHDARCAGTCIRGGASRIGYFPRASHFDVSRVAWVGERRKESEVAGLGQKSEEGGSPVVGKAIGGGSNRKYDAEKKKNISRGRKRTKKGKRKMEDGRRKESTIYDDKGCNAQVVRQGTHKAGPSPMGWPEHKSRAPSMGSSWPWAKRFTLSPPPNTSPPQFFPTHVLLGVLLAPHRKDAKDTHVHVLSPPSFLGWHAILRPLQKKHARKGSFCSGFFPPLPRWGKPSSSSHPIPSSLPRLWPFGSKSGYVMKVNVCKTGLLGGCCVDGGDEDNPLKREVRLDLVPPLATMSS